MSSTSRLCGVLSAVLVFFASAQAGLFNSDEALAASEGYAADSRFDSVGAVYSQDSASGTWVGGSGVLIDPEWVLTAGHNLLVWEENSDVRFYFGDNIFESYTEMIADAWYVCPGYTVSVGGGHGVDLGLIHLSEPVLDVNPAVLYSGEDQRGTLMFMAGYGQPGTRASGPQDFDGIKRAGNNIAGNFGGDGPYVGEPQYWLARFDPAGFPNEQSLEWQTAPGDSGAGWFADIGNESMLVGINSFEAGNYNWSGALRVSLYNHWIYSTMGVPEPATIALLATGAVTVLLLRRRRRTEEPHGGCRKSSR